jgi:hypothetical protein
MTPQTPPPNTSTAAPAIAAAAEPDLIDALVSFVVTAHPPLAGKRDEMTADLRAEFGGQRWYISARPETARQRRVREILALFNGRNATEVARVLRISRATVYRVIKQPGLPPGEAAANVLMAASGGKGQGKKAAQANPNPQPSTPGA